MSTSPSRRTALLVGASVALLTGCGSSSDSGSDGGVSGAPAAASKVAVVASTDVYGDIVAHIGGDKVSVTSVISDPDQDPHSYEAGTRNQLALSKAKVVVENGGGYDDFVDRMLRSGGNSSADSDRACERPPYAGALTTSSPPWARRRMPTCPSGSCPAGSANAFG